jgi:hypothetical protein
MHTHLNKCKNDNILKRSKLAPGWWSGRAPA